MRSLRRTRGEVRDSGAIGAEFPGIPKAPPSASPTREAGAAAVEFALVVPLLLLLVFGIIQFGITFGQVLALNNASRQGARVGVVSLNRCDAVMASVKQGVGGAIALAYPVTVTVARGATPVCAGSIASSGTVTYSSGSATSVACISGSATSALTVAASSTTSFNIPPFFFIKNYVVNGSGVYQCEN